MPLWQIEYDEVSSVVAKCARKHDNMPSGGVLPVEKHDKMSSRMPLQRRKCDKVPSGVSFQWRKHIEMSSCVPFWWIICSCPAGGENMMKCPLRCPSSRENVMLCASKWLIVPCAFLLQTCSSCTSNLSHRIKQFKCQMWSSNLRLSSPPPLIRRFGRSFLF